MVIDLPNLSTARFNGTDTVQLLHTLMSKSSLGMAIVDRQFRFVYINDHFQRLLEKQKNGNHLGSTVEEVVGSQVWSRLQPWYEKARDGESFSDIMLSDNHNLSPQPMRYYSLSLYPLAGEKAIEESFIGVMVQETTALKETEQKLSLFRDRLHLAQQASGIGSFDWNMTTNEVWWSPEQIALLGAETTQNKVTIKEFEKRILPSDLPHVQKCTQEAIEKKINWDCEFRILMPDKTVKWLRGIGRFYYNHNDEIVRMVGINYDITPHKSTETLLQFKAAASRVLASSLHKQDIIERVCELGIKYMADWCAVDLLNAQGEVELQGVAHVDPKKVKWARKLRQQHPLDLSQESGVAQVLRTGKPEFYPLITDKMIEQSVTNDTQKNILRKIGFTSLLIVPLHIQGKCRGAITFVSAESRRKYAEHDLEAAEQLASRTSLALENALLYNTVKKEQERLENLLAEVPCVVWEAYGPPDKPEQQLYFVNSYAETLLGYSTRRWSSTPHFWLKIVHPEDRDRAAAEAHAIYESGKEGVSRFRWIAQNGKVFWVEAHSVVIKNRQGKPVGMRGITMDMSQSIELEQRKDDFIAMASHELKTPVTSLRVFTQVLRASIPHATYPRVGEYLHRMEKQISTLEELVSDLLDLSKIRAGKLALRKEKFHLQELLTEIIQNLQTTTVRHHIEQEGCASLEVYGDRNRIGQVLANLLTNAIKYSPDAERIHVRFYEQKQYVKIEVQDHGIGISAEHKEELFQRFYRIFDATDKTFPGLGMGLFISNEIVKRHNGKMAVRSTLGKGSTFSFTIPKHLPEPEQESV